MHMRNKELTCVKLDISSGIASKKKAMTYNKKTRSSEDGVASNDYQCQVYVNDISWSEHQISASYQSKRDYRFSGSLPKQLSFDIPANVMEQIEKNPSSEHDIVETFVCNALTRKFMHEVMSCQIWILF